MSFWLLDKMGYSGGEKTKESEKLVLKEGWGEWIWEDKKEKNNSA
jgi:hypothetical protein